MFGIYSDSVGRKILLISGIALALLANFSILFISKFPQLLLLRILSGFGAGACPPLTRAILRDRFAGSSLLKANSCLSMAITLSPAIAPFLGGLLQQHYGWHASFIVVSAWSLLIMFCLFIFLAETHPLEKRQHLSFGKLRQSILAIIKNSRFLTAASISSLAIAANLAYFVLSPFIFQNLYKLSPLDNGAVYIFNAAASLLGAFFVAWKSNAASSENILRLGLTLSLLGAILMLGNFLLNWPSYLLLIAPMLLISFAFGMIMPATGTIAVSEFKHMSGTCAALLGFIRMGGASLLLSLLAKIKVQPNFILAYALLGMFTLGYLIFLKHWAARKTSRRPRGP